MRHQKPVVFTLLALFILKASTSFAHEPRRGRVMATFGPTVYQTLATGRDKGYQAPFMGGAGLIAEGDVDHNGGIEIGMFYQQKLFFAQKDVRTLVEKIKLIAISTGYRHWFNPSLSLGLAFYSSYTMGDPRVIYKNFPGETELRTSARDVTEYGFDFSAQWEFWTAKEMGALIDARYSQSVTSKEHESSNQYMFLIGFKHSIYVK